MSNISGINMAGESNVGLVRRRNEDNFCLVSVPGRNSALAVVADGVGGHSNGAMASLITCRDLMRGYFAVSDALLEAEGGAEHFLSSIADETNHKIFCRNRFERQRRPMCSTVIAVLFVPGRVVVAGAGDSRCYELSPEGQLQQLSHDHTLWGNCIQNNQELPPAREKWKDVIVRAVGPRPHLGMEVESFPQKPGSRYLLCSDGVYRSLEDAEVARILRGATSAREAVDGFLKASLRAGGGDNITAVVMFS